MDRTNTYSHAELTQVLLAIVEVLPPKYEALAFRAARAELRAIRSGDERLSNAGAPAAIAEAERIMWERGDATA